MSPRISFPVLAFGLAVVLTGCGPSSKDVEAVAAADAAACELAMIQFDRAQVLLDDGIDASDLEEITIIAGELEAVASEAPIDGDRLKAIRDAADGLSRWAERGIGLDDDSIPLYADGPMFILEANCSDDESR